MFIVAALQACDLVPVTYAPPDGDAAAKQFQCPEGPSCVYVFRDSNFGYRYPMPLAAASRPRHGLSS